MSFKYEPNSGISDLPDASRGIQARFLANTLTAIFKHGSNSKTAQTTLAQFRHRTTQLALLLDSALDLALVQLLPKNLTTI